MVRILLGMLLLGLILTGCDKKEDDPYHGPVWILNVTVRDGSRPDFLMQNCAHVIWNFAGQSETHDVGCRNSNGFVKIWEPISEDVRVFYHVECEGYSPTGESFVDFSYAQVDTVEGRDNPEVIHNVTVDLYPN